MLLKFSIFLHFKCKSYINKHVLAKDENIEIPMEYYWVDKVEKSIAGHIAIIYSKAIILNLKSYVNTPESRDWY